MEARRPTREDKVDIFSRISARKERLVVVYVRMDEKKLMKLSKLILEEKILFKKSAKNA